MLTISQTAARHPASGELAGRSAVVTGSRSRQSSTTCVPSKTWKLTRGSPVMPRNTSPARKGAKA